MSLPIKKVFFGDYVFDVWENVYEPAEDSFLFAENLVIGQNDDVIDIGTGCGILGVVAAAKASRVVSVDVNPYAIRCAKENARQNRVSGKMFFIQGNLFNPLRIEDKFDVILFNAPYLPVHAEGDDSWLARAWAGGATGRQVIERFVRESPRFLKQDGRILLMQSTLSNVDETLLGFRENRLRARVIAECALPFFETIVLIEARAVQ